jgi:hypothetical protein
LNRKCGSADKKTKRGEVTCGHWKGKSTDVPTHAGWKDNETCCLEFLLTEPAGFIEQKNSILELVLPRENF